MPQDLGQVLAIVQEIRAIVAALQQMGLRLEGTIDVPTILALIRP